MASKATVKGTESLVNVEIKMKKGKGTQNGKGCIVNYKKLKLKCNQHCFSCDCAERYPVMLILPVKVIREDVEEIEAHVHTTFSKNSAEDQKLKLATVNKVIEPQQLNHQFVGCSLEALQRYNRKLINRFKRQEYAPQNVKLQYYIETYKKGIAKVEPSELKKQDGKKLFGIAKGNEGFRAKFVELQLSESSGELIKCNQEDKLEPSGILFYGEMKHKTKKDDEDYYSYDVKVIGSYSEGNDGKITFQLIFKQDGTVAPKCPGKGVQVDLNFATDNLTAEDKEKCHGSVGNEVECSSQDPPSLVEMDVDHSFQTTGSKKISENDDCSNQAGSSTKYKKPKITSGTTADDQIRLLKQRSTKLKNEKEI